MKLILVVSIAALSAAMAATGFADRHQDRFEEAVHAQAQGAYPNVQYANRMSQFVAMAESRADVVMLGDSNTEFGEWRELLPHVAILNRGISGDTSSGIRARVAEVMRHKPKVVFLLVGVNDLSSGVEPEVVKSNIASIISALGARTVLLDVLYTTNPGLNQKITELNSLLHQLSVEHLDLNREVAPQRVLLPQYTRDGVHLSGAGYLVWRDKIKPYLAGEGAGVEHSAMR